MGHERNAGRHQVEVPQDRVIALPRHAPHGAASHGGFLPDWVVNPVHVLRDT
ncbi:MAG: hypothetical protein U0163_15855 [Gemmatimonadaceae bacterium]